MTAARWMREIVTTHPEYQQDSVVSDSIAFDLLTKCDEVQQGLIECSKLFKKPQNKSVYSMPPGTIRHNTVVNHTNSI